MKTAQNPYYKLDNSCLRNEITFEDEILDTDEIECLALCDAHPQCRYFLYGKDSNSASLQARQCRLFSAQAKELTDCDDYNKNYSELTANVNGRTFKDQLTWFDEPESVFAVLGGVSYQECASLCDSLEDRCGAFSHSWNYRTSSAGQETPEIFSRTRIMKADFGPPSPQALFLQFDLEKNSLVVSTAETKTEVSRQLAILESAVEGDETFFLRFLQDTRYCVAAANTYAQVLDPFILRVIKDNAGGESVPSCQKLVLEECSSGENVIAFLSSETDGRLSFAYKVPENKTVSGCMRVGPSTTPDYEERTNGMQSFDIPIIKNCGPIVEDSVSCAVLRGFVEYSVSKNTTEASLNNTMSPAPTASPVVYRTKWEYEDVNCTDQVVDSETCATSPVLPPPNSMTNVTLEMCQFPPDANFSRCDAELIGPETNVTEEVTIIDETGTAQIIPRGSVSQVRQQTCYRSSRTTSQECSFTQKTTLSLLGEMSDYFAGQTECSGSDSREVYSRSYGPGCDFDGEQNAGKLNMFLVNRLSFLTNFLLYFQNHWSEFHQGNLLLLPIL